MTASRSRFTNFLQSLNLSLKIRYLQITRELKKNLHYHLCENINFYGSLSRFQKTTIYALNRYQNYITEMVLYLKFFSSVCCDACKEMVYKEQRFTTSLNECTEGIRRVQIPQCTFGESQKES